MVSNGDSHLRMWKRYENNLSSPWYVYANEWTNLFHAVRLVIVFERSKCTFTLHGHIKIVDNQRNKHSQWITIEIVFDRWKRWILFTICFELLHFVIKYILWSMVRCLYLNNGGQNTTRNIISSVMCEEDDNHFTTNIQYWMGTRSWVTRRYKHCGVEGANAWTQNYICIQSI